MTSEHMRGMTSLFPPPLSASLRDGLPDPDGQGPGANIPAIELPLRGLIVVPLRKTADGWTALVKKTSDRLTHPWDLMPATEPEETTVSDAASHTPDPARIPLGGNRP